MSKDLSRFLNLHLSGLFQALLSSLSLLHRLRPKYFVLLFHLNCKVLQAGIKEGVEVLSDGLLHKVGVDAPGHHPHTDEGRQQGAGLELGSVRECVEADQTHQVTQGLKNVHG